MREYQRKKPEKYNLPKAVYHTVLWRVRDYYRLKELANNYLTLCKTEEAGGSKGSFISDKVANAVIKREQLLEEIGHIDSAIKEIPEEYRTGVWNNVQFGQSYPLDAGRNTYGRYKAKFISELAERFNLI